MLNNDVTLLNAMRYNSLTVVARLSPRRCQVFCPTRFTGNVHHDLHLRHRKECEGDSAHTHTTISFDFATTGVVHQHALQNRCWHDLQPLKCHGSWNLSGH